MEDVLELIERLGGLMRACKAMKLLLQVPRARNGKLTLTRPGSIYGQAKETRKIELTEEITRRLDLIRDSPEYVMRRSCVTLGKDLFLEQAKMRLVAKAEAESKEQEGGSAEDGQKRKSESVDGKKQGGNADGKAARLQ